MPITNQEFESALETALDQFLPYQKIYIADRSRFVIVEKAVRIGMTYAHSFKSSLKRMTRGGGRKINELFASKNRVIATDYMNYHRKWAEFWNLIHGETVVDTSNWTSEICRYPGGDVMVLSSDPEAFRGMEGDVTLDEFAFHEQQQRLWATAQSRIQWLGDDGQVTLISSHLHPETVFMQLVERAKKGVKHFSLHRTTLYDAVEQGLALRVPGGHRSLLVAA